MAVHAQYPSNAFPPDLHSWAQAGTNVLESLRMMQSRENQMDHILPTLRQAVVAGDVGMQPVAVGNTTDCSEHPRSELTGNVSGFRKRSREETFGTAANHAGAMPSISLLPMLGGVEQSRRVFESAATSTSGQRSLISPSHALYSAPTQALLAQIYHQNLEVDAVIRLQSERLRLVLEEARRRHCKALISVLEQRVAKRMREKETELADANRKNAELEEKVREISAENQMWFNLAKNNEAIIARLRTSLEQVLLQNTAAAAAEVHLREGYGESDGTARLTADDAQSCCFEEAVAPSAPISIRSKQSTPTNDELRRRMACRVCEENEVCVLILPCRHLCLCKGCEMTVGKCPVCRSPKNSCLQIFTS
ncbi:hypothetical protein AXF42_Ash002233 [Apostasia shenzhenica]|uniref:RING-type domain-containing protein n=1 Tax=Apostasia shenzhenica TaxID=1088818 RepID=A0A2I0AMZ0_9ASPA|nr:hypothetical protein AXF42_Ash002233 [Apostasia shenzhenica]